MNTEVSVLPPVAPASPEGLEAAPSSPTVAASDLEIRDVDYQPSTLGYQHLNRLPNETPRAFSAFIAFFQLGQVRSLPAVADKLDISLDTIKKWSSRHEWNSRINDFNAGLLRQQAAAEVVRQMREASDWAKRLESFREQEWNAAQKLLGAAECFLENFGDEDLSNVTLAQVSRALSISSQIGRLALSGAELSPNRDPETSPLQQHLLDAVQRLYGERASQNGKDGVPAVPNLVPSENGGRDAVPSVPNLVPCSPEAPSPALNQPPSTTN